MTKWTFKVGILVMLLCVFSPLINMPSSATIDETNRILKVGLQYGSVKDQNVVFYSEKGYRFGQFSGDTFQSILDLSGAQYITLIKNGTSDTESIITTPGADTSQIIGKYHVQVGGIQPTYDACSLVLDKVRTVDPSAFPAYDGGWRVYTGAYFSEAEQLQKMATLSAASVPFDIIKAPMNYNAMMLTVDNQVKVLFSTLELDFGVKSTADDGVMSFNKYRYRGGLVVKRYKDSDPTVINYIPLEQYLYGVVPYEISPKWHIEAQKAQAVAARNYALTSLSKHKKYGFDVCSTDDCQVYAGYNVESALSNQAVDLTKGVTLKYNGKLAMTYFHSNSGGRTENSENVWTTAVPYLVAVDDPYSIGQPNDVWTVTYTPDQIKQALAAKKIDIGDITSVVVNTYSPNGRALKTTFTGTKGSVSYEKDKLRSLFSAKEFKSIWFTVSAPGQIAVQSQSGLKVLSASGTLTSLASSVTALSSSGNTAIDLSVSKSALSADGSTKVVVSAQTPSGSATGYTFTGKGWGHGIGMSQWGAKVMAEKGFTYEQILTHYYQNTYLN